VGENFVARMDAKADRKQKILTIHNLHFEPLKLSKPQLAKITVAIKTFAGFNQCNAIIIKKSNNRQHRKLISDNI